MKAGTSSSSSAQPEQQSLQALTLPSAQRSPTHITFGERERSQPPPASSASPSQRFSLGDIAPPRSPSPSADRGSLRDTLDFYNQSIKADDPHARPRSRNSIHLQPGGRRDSSSVEREGDASDTSQGDPAVIGPSYRSRRGSASSVGRNADDADDHERGALAPPFSPTIRTHSAAILPHHSFFSPRKPAVLRQASIGGGAGRAQGSGPQPPWSPHSTSQPSLASPVSPHDPTSREPPQQQQQQHAQATNSSPTHDRSFSIPRSHPHSDPRFEGPPVSRPAPLSLSTVDNSGLSPTSPTDKRRTFLDPRTTSPRASVSASLHEDPLSSSDQAAQRQQQPLMSAVLPGQPTAQQQKKLDPTQAARPSDEAAATAESSSPFAGGRSTPSPTSGSFPTGWHPDGRGSLDTSGDASATYSTEMAGLNAGTLGLASTPASLGHLVGADNETAAGSTSALGHSSARASTELGEGAGSSAAKKDGRDCGELGSRTNEGAAASLHGQQSREPLLSGSRFGGATTGSAGGRRSGVDDEGDLSPFADHASPYDYDRSSASSARRRAPIHLDDQKVVAPAPSGSSRSLAVSQPSNGPSGRHGSRLAPQDPMSPRQPSQFSSAGTSTATSRRTRSTKAKRLRNHALLQHAGNRFFLNGLIMTSSDSPLPFLGSLALVLILPGLFFGFTAPFVWRHISPAAVVVFAYVCAVTWSSMLTTAWRDPGVLPRNLDPDPPTSTGNGADDDPLAVPLPRIMRVKDVDVKVKWCETCGTFRAPRSSHCRLCDNCVENIDHHCTFLNTCIGRRNYHSFMAFLLASLVAIWLCIALCILHLYYLTRPPTEKLPGGGFGSGYDFREALKHGPISAVLVVLCAITMCPILALSGYHLRLIWLNRTTVEQLRLNASHSLSEKHLPNAQRNPFALPNPFRNVLWSLCRPVSYSWIERTQWATEDDRRENPGWGEMVETDGWEEEREREREELEALERKKRLEEEGGNGVADPGLAA